jgi:hypothetical protein
MTLQTQIQPIIAALQAQVAALTANAAALNADAASLTSDAAGLTSDAASVSAQAAEITATVAILNSQIAALNAIIVVSPPPPPPTVSPPGTTLTAPGGTITDKKLNAWMMGVTVSGGGYQVMKNGVQAYGGTASKIEIDVTGLVWIQNPQSGTWYYDVEPAGATPGYWQQAATGPVTTIVTPPPGGMAIPSGWKAVVDDLFAGTSLNPALWGTVMGDTPYPDWSDSGGLPPPDSEIGVPSQFDAEFMTPGAVTVNNGLTITASPSTKYASLGYTWQAGLINSLGKWLTPNGPFRLRVKAQVPSCMNGEWPGIWMLGTDGAELDIYEGGYTALGLPNQTVATNLHTGSNQQQFENAGVDLSLAPHIYEVDVSPGVSVTWFRDGVQIASTTNAVPNEQFSVIIDLQMATGNASGWHTVTSGSTPQKMIVNEVQLLVPA